MQGFEVSALVMQRKGALKYFTNSQNLTVGEEGQKVEPGRETEIGGLKEDRHKTKMAQQEHGGLRFDMIR